MQSNVANKFNSINSDREKENSKQIVVPGYQSFAEFTWRVAENFARLLKELAVAKKFDRTPQKKAISTRREFVVAYTELLEQPLQLWTAIVEE